VRLLEAGHCVPQQAARIRVLLLVRLAERQRGAGAPATSSVDLRNSTLMQQSGFSAEMPGCRPFQQREGYGRWWLLRHESDRIRLLVAADWPPASTRRLLLALAEPQVQQDRADAPLGIF
jgi:hypothetical protein